MGVLDGKVALITGAGGELGRAQAERFAQEGAAVVVTDLSPEPSEGPTACVRSSSLSKTVSSVLSNGGSIEARHGDVRRLSDMESIAALAVEKFGAIDLVCANAGIWAIGSSWELDPADWQRVIDVNLTGAWHTARATVPALRSRGGGCIIFTSSIAAYKGTRHMAPYVASKAGLLGLTRTMANELGEFGIRVNAILPGLVATPMVLNDAYLRHARPDLESPDRSDLEAASAQRNALHQGILRPEEIAEAAIWLGSDAARFVTGVALPVDSGAAIS